MSRRGRGPGSGPRSRATAAINPQDVILVEPDNNNAPQDRRDEDNESASDPAVSDGDTEIEGIAIGVPSPNYNINDSVLYSHNYFQKVRGDDGKSTFQAKCLVCLVDKKVKTLIKTTDNNTKGMVSHLLAAHESYVEKWRAQRDEVDTKRKKTREKRGMVKTDSSRQMKLVSDGGKTLSVQPVFDKALQDRWDKARIMFAARAMCSFYALKHTDLFAKALLPNTHHRLQNKTVHTLSRQTGKIADGMRAEIFSIVMGAREFCDSFNFTSDMWKSANIHSFVCLTIHFLTPDWDLIKLVPYSEYFGPQRHTAENILISLNVMMIELGIEGPEFEKFILLDNVSNNRKAMRLGGADYKPVWCCNHTLQLSIGDTFRTKMGHISVKRIIGKCKEISKLCRRSEANRDALKGACVDSDTPFIMPWKPGATRWNSKEKSLSSVIRLQPALQKLSVTDTTDTWSVEVPTAREFETAKAMKQCLKPLKDATLVWEADREPTLQTVIRELWNIKTKLEHLSTTGDGVKMFARNLQRNIDKRFKNCGTENTLFAIAHWLDPDLRGIILKQYRGAYERTVAEIKRMCHQWEPEPVPEREQRTDNEEDEDESTLTGAQQLKKRLRLSGATAAAPATAPSLSKIDIEVENYERFVEDEDCSNICAWWKKNKASFPLLERLARKILSIPASSSSSERTFSAGTRACSAKRYNLSPKRISDLMILNVNEDDVEQYREKYGIKKLYTGQVKKLVDIEFCGDLRMAEETLDPPMYNLNEPEDEFLVESDFSDEEEEEDDNTEEEIDSEDESVE